MDEQPNRYMQHFWEDILIGDVALGAVGTAGALGLFGEGCSDDFLPVGECTV